MQAYESDRVDGIVIVSAVVLIAGVVYVISLFIAGSVGIVKQLVDPATYHDFNAAILAWMAFPLATVAYLITPEFGRNFRQRVPVAGGAAAVGTAVFIIAALFLVPSIERPSALEYLAGGLTLFVAFGIMPAVAAARIATFYNADVVVARQGDHLIDTKKLTPETARIIAKHCGKEMRRPPGWRPFTLWGDAGRLTAADLQKVITLEEAEEKQLAELYRQRTLNEKRGKDVDAMKALADLKASAEREIASLREEVKHVREAAAKAEVQHRAGSVRVEASRAETLREVARLKDEQAQAAARHANEARQLRAVAATAENISHHWAYAAEAAHAKHDAVSASTAACMRALSEELEAANVSHAATLRELALDKNALARMTAQLAELSGDCRTLQVALAGAKTTSGRLARSRRNLQARVRRSEAAVAELTHDLAAARERFEHLQKEQADLQARAAADSALLRRMVAAAERDAERLSDELARYVSASTKKPARARSPHGGERAPASERTPETGVSRRLTLVVNNSPASATLSKSPQRQGVPQRRWRRTQHQLRKQGASE